MSAILPTSLLAQPFALSTATLDELQAPAPLAALDVTAVTAVTTLASEPVTPVASTDVDFSPVAQFQSALAQSHQLLDELQTPAIGGGNGAPAAGTQPLSGIEQLHALTDAAQNLVAAYNLLQADGATTTATPPAPATAAAPAPLLTNLLNTISQPNPAADASQAAGPATLADIGITLQPAPAVDAGAGPTLDLDAQALQTAYAANPQGTVALLNQTTDTFEQLGDQYAEQRSADAAVPPLLAAVQAGVAGSTSSNSAGVVPAAGVSQDTLADLALLDAFAGSATPAQSASTASNEAAALAQLDQLDVRQQQHQLDQARDAYTAQTAALPPQGVQRTTIAPGANNIQATQNTARTQLGEQATQEQLSQQIDAEQYAARLLDNKQLADSATQRQDDAATQLRIVEQQQESAASAAQTQVLSAGAAALSEQQQTAALADAAALTLTENAALTQEASAANPAAADDLAAEAAVADAQAGVGATATPAAIAAAPLAQTPPDNGAGNADPLAVNPALAAAIAAYRLGGATAPVQNQGRPPQTAQRPEPVQKVAPVEPVDSASDAPLS